MSNSIGLFVCAGFSLNLILQFALGIQQIAEHHEAIIRNQDSGGELQEQIPLFQAGILCASVFVLWCLCSYLIVPLTFGFFEYLLPVPLSIFACIGLEALSERFVPSIVPASRCFDPESGYNGLAPTALWLTLHIAGTPLGALVTALSFGGGLLLSMLLLGYIRRRSAVEAVPKRLRGRPLLLLSTGLLSLLFTSLTALLFSILGIF